MYNSFGSILFPFWPTFDWFQITHYLFQGLPDRLRPTAWPQLSGSIQLVQKSTGVYDILLKRQAPQAARDLLDLDIQRTFPTHPLFKEFQGPGQRALKNVLLSFSIFHSKIGYCQGISFIAAILLTQMDEEVSWCFVSTHSVWIVFFRLHFGH